MGDLEVPISCGYIIDVVKECQICGKDFEPISYGDNRTICPDCEKALGEIITWWNSTARDWWVSKEIE